MLFIIQTEQYCITQQYKSYISMSPGHPLGIGAGLRPASNTYSTSDNHVFHLDNHVAKNIQI